MRDCQVFNKVETSTSVLIKNNINRSVSLNSSLFVEYVHTDF
jgi:hypothetical protein